MCGEELGVSLESFKPAGLYLALSEPAGTGPRTSTETTGGLGAASWLMGTGWDGVQDMAAFSVSFSVDGAKPIAQSPSSFPGAGPMSTKPKQCPDV